MNCTEVRARLPLLLYGDLEAVQAEAVEHHLAACPACRGEYAAFRHLRRDLDRAPVPAVQVDLGRIYQTAAARQARRLRHWRAAAVLLAGLAAAAAVLLVLKVEVRVDATQLVVRWAAPPATPAPAPAPQPIAAPAPDEHTRELVADLEKRLDLTTELLRAVVRDVDNRDGDRQTEIARLRLQLNALQQRENARYTETRHDVSALYQAQFGPMRKENEP